MTGFNFYEVVNKLKISAQNSPNNLPNYTKSDF